MGAASRSLLATAVCVASLPCSPGKVLEGYVSGTARLHSPDQDIVVLGSFGFECFEGKCGQPGRAAYDKAEKAYIRIEAHGDARIDGQMIAMFASEPWRNGTSMTHKFWTQIYRNPTMSCMDKAWESIFFIPLGPGPGDDAQGGDVDGLDTLDMFHYVPLGPDPMFVYVVAMNCAPGQPLSMYYKVSLENPGGWWGREFSYDDQGLLQAQVCLFVCTLGMAVHVAITAWNLHSAQLSHPPLLVLGAAIWGITLSHLLEVIFYADYASHGFGAHGALVSAEVLYTASDLTIMVLFLLIAQGWRLTDDELAGKDQLLIATAVIVYITCYTIIYCVDYALRDPASEVYVLLTSGAFFLVVIRIMLLMLCGLFFTDTYKREPSVEKLAFFRRAIASCLLWFLQMPLTCIVAMCISKWVRHRAATISMGIVQTAVLAYLLRCFQPDRAKDYFTITVTASELEGLASGASAGVGEDWHPTERHTQPRTAEWDDANSHAPASGSAVHSHSSSRVTYTELSERAVAAGGAGGEQELQHRQDDSGML